MVVLSKCYIIMLKSATVLARLACLIHIFRYRVSTEYLLRYSNKGRLEKQEFEVCVPLWWNYTFCLKMWETPCLQPLLRLRLAPPLGSPPGSWASPKVSFFRYIFFSSKRVKKKTDVEALSGPNGDEKVKKGTQFRVVAPLKSLLVSRTCFRGCCWCHCQNLAK